MDLRSPARGVRICCLLTLVLGLLAGGLVMAGPTPEGKASRGQKPGKRVRPKFKCPDPLAAEGCQYFAGLLATQDQTVKRLYDPSGFEYVCFRDESDQFFTVHLSGPSRRDPLRPDSPPVPGTSPSGQGKVAAFARGVKDATLAPQLQFKGTWLGLHYFVATEINGQGVSGSVAGSISADPQQFSALWRYQSPAGALVDYRLVIHSSTGRFSETFAENPSRIPSVVKGGHCMPLPMMPPK